MPVPKPQPKKTAAQTAPSATLEVEDSGKNLMNEFFPDPAPRPEEQQPLRAVDDLPGWGIHVRLFNNLGGETTAFWRRTRRFNGRTWELSGNWVDTSTGNRVPWQPVGWLPKDLEP